MYFQDLCAKDKKLIIDYVTRLIKQDKPNYKKQAKECGMTPEEWMEEEVYDYINRHDNDIEIREMLVEALISEDNEEVEDDD